MFDIITESDIKNGLVFKTKDINFLKIFFNRINNIKIVISMDDDKKILKKHIKKFMRYRNFLKKVNYGQIILNNYCENKTIHKQFKELLNAICNENKYTIYSIAYDLSCDYLDSFFYDGENLCEFKDNKCGYRKNLNIEVGCCRHFEKHKHFGLLFGEKLVKCEYLSDDGHCSIKCLGCKLFTCPYLEKKGIKFKMKEIFPIYCIFNWKQKILLKGAVYTPKEEIMKYIMFLR